MRRTSRWWGGLALAVLWTVGVQAAPAPEKKIVHRIQPIPGGVTDADGAKGFVANADGGITGVDLETGKVLWESKTAGRPTAVMGGWVWVLARDKAKANVLHVLGLALDDGRARLETDPVVLPEWIDATPGNGGGRSFAVSARLSADGLDLFLKWQADAHYWGGAAPSPEVLKAARKHADGVARVNLSDNQVEMLETAKAPSPGPKVSDELRKAAARNYGEPEPTVAVVEDNAVAVDVQPAGDKQKVVLKRWDLKTEKPLESITLADGAMVQVVALPSAGVALVSDAAPTATEQTWTAYSLSTGKETGRYTAETGASDFSVVGPRAYYVVKGQLKGPPFGGVLPRTLKAVDLKTGKRLWDMPLEGERLPPPPPP